MRTSAVARGLRTKNSPMIMFSRPACMVRLISNRCPGFHRLSRRCAIVSPTTPSVVAWSTKKKKDDGDENAAGFPITRPHHDNNGQTHGERLLVVEPPSSCGDSRGRNDANTRTRQTRGRTRRPTTTYEHQVQHLAIVCIAFVVAQQQQCLYQSVRSSGRTARRKGDDYSRNQFWFLVRFSPTSRGLSLLVAVS